MSSSESSAVGGVQGFLLKLHSFLGDTETRHAAVICHDIIGDLGQECMVTKNQNELAFQTSLLFAKEGGLLTFLRKSLATEMLQDARVDILNLLTAFLQRMADYVKGWEKNYAVELKDTCLVVYTKDKAAKSRGPALELLIKVLYLTKDSSVAQDFKIGDMFNKFYGELCQKSRIPDTVLGNIYELLGVLGEVHPSEMVNNSDKLYKAYLGELKVQMTSVTKEPKLPVVAGCLRGITALMVNFTKSVEEDPATSKEIFDYALKAICPQTEMKRYAVPCAGLKLFTKHAGQFSSCLMDHYMTVFDMMSKLCGHINLEMKKTSYAALESFLKQVAILVAKDVERHQDKLKFFMQKFCSIIRTMDSSNKELSIAIRGYGLFAAPCKVVCPQDVDLMYVELIQRCKQMYLIESDRDDDNVYQLPSFLDSIASVLIHLDKIPEVYTSVLERLLVVQIDTFPQYSQKMQYTTCRSIIKVLVAMAARGPVLWSFTSSVVHQGLIRVCSKPVAYVKEEGATQSSVRTEEEAEPTVVRSGKWKVPSSKDYLDLFKELLDCENMKDTRFLDDAALTRNYSLKALNMLLYDALVQSIMKILEKLDLSLQKVNTDDEGQSDVGSGFKPSSDPTSNLIPNKPKDFTAFLNLVDFCSALLPSKNPEYFTQWVYPLCHELILQSIRFPLVSGFYKLLSLSMLIAKKIKYFQGQGPKSISDDSWAGSACFALVSKFGKEVCMRIKQYKDELLAACLTFVLSLHPDMVALDIKAYIPALQAALRLGLSHAPLATTALDALESWSSYISPAIIQPHYIDILPHLDGYLKTGTSTDKDESSMNVTFVSAGTAKSYGKVMMRLLQKSKHLPMGDEPPIAAVRRRVVRLLGHLGGQLNRSLVTAISTEDMMRQFVAWDSEKRLNFAVPFKDIKPEIYLDPFLPRTAELALSSSDRQTKVAACELLHSLVVYMVGRGAQMAEGEKSTPPMYNLHKRVFPVLLRLACDVDQVTRQLFEPLVMQLIHWFTNNKKFESQDTVAVLEAILDGVVDPLDSTLRDFSGRCIQEFVKWSIKQTTPEQQQKSPANIKSLFKRIYSLALHPNVFKRLGAALAFNNIYRHFREEDSLVQQFVFEVLVVFVESLALAHSDEKSLGTVQQCCSALDHLKRIIKHKAVSLNQATKRRIPRGFPPDQSLSLSDMVTWLLTQCGRPQTECRHKCLELFYEFVPLLPGRTTAAQWLEEQVKNEGQKFLITRLEGGGLLYQPTLRDVEAPFSVRATLQWMDLLLAVLDCYNTFTSLRLLQPQRILDSGEKSSFLPALRFFLTELALHDLKAARSCFKMSDSTWSHFSPRERELYNYSKCTIVVRLLEFSTMVLLKCQKDVWKLLEQDFFSATFFTLVTMTVCEPSSIGFNMADLEVMTQLPEVCVPLLKALAATSYRTDMENGFRKMITAQCVEELCSVDLYDPDTHDSHTKLELLLSACKQLHQSGILRSVLHNQDLAYSSSLGSRLLMAVYKGIAPGENRKSLPSMDVGSRKLGNGLVQLAFSLDDQTEQLVGLLLNSITLSVPLSGSLNPHFLSFSHGEYFYSLFQNTINTELLQKLDRSVPLLLIAATQSPGMVSVLLNGMLDHSFRERSVRKTQGSRLAEQILKQWDLLKPWWTGPSSSPESKTSTLTLLSKVLQIDSSVSTNTSHSAFTAVFATFTTLITDTALSLNLKSQALIMLPFFTTLPSGPLEELQRALEALVAAHFPMQSDEFPRGSLQRNNYMDCVRKFLDALELSQSPLLLKLMAKVLCRDKKHIMEDRFQTCFQRIARQSACEGQVLLLYTIYQMFQDKDVPRNSMLLDLLDRVLVPLATHCSAKALSQFFITNVANIMTTLQARFTKAIESAFEGQIIMKIGGCKLLELLYSRLPKEEVYSKDSAINQAFCSSTKAEGNELSKTLLKSCFEAFTENMAGESALLELRRQYHCAAYNCAIAVISCSFNETKFYQGFLFTEKPEKNQFIFDNLIDTQRTYMFPIEIDFPIERKRKYVMIRKEVSGENGDAPVYLSSQSYMADSSLSEEMSQFDFSTGVQSFSYNSQNPSGHGSTSRARKNVEVLSQDESVELEMDELNQHECMATMTALFRHMQRNNITPKVEEGVIPSDLPPWMKFLHGKLGNPSTPLNIRLFIAKLIINTEEVFRPYARHWLGPLLQLVVSGNNGGEGIHFMVVDIVVTLLSWTSVSPKGNTRDEILANRLMEFLMKNCFHAKKAVFRHNLEIIRTIVECWKDCLHIPYNLIFDYYSGKDPNSKDNSVGLQLLGIVLANELPPYDPTCGVEHDRYFQALANNLSFIRYKEIYSAAAEIIGLILKYMTGKESQYKDPLLSVTVTKLMDLKKKNLDDKFVICLCKLSKHFPPLVDRFVNAVFYLLPKLHGVLKTYCLECVLSRADVIPDIFLHLKTKGFTQMMAHRDEARQRVCLDIMHKILPILKPEEMKEILGAVNAFVSHPSPACRERMYDILMWIQDNYSDAESREDSTCVEVLNEAKETLLQGLTDENQGLQLYVRNFWSHEKRLPSATVERLLKVLSCLYSACIEERFLSLATDLLLEMTSQSPDYTRNMFEFPLSECKFLDYTIDSNWRLRSTVLTPMFMETQVTQTAGTQQADSAEMQPASMKGQIRATQASLEFSQTQAPGAGRRSAYNWLTGSSVDTLADYSLSSDTASSLLVFEKRKAERSAAWRAVGANFGSKRLTNPTDETDSRSAAAQERRADILRLKRRFLKDREKENIKFAKREIQSQRTEREKRATQKIQQEAQVTLYRSYRVGDLPDIQIQYSSLIAPLQALAQRDSTLAKQLFSSLFSGVLVKMEQSRPSKEREGILKNLLQDMNNFLHKSTTYFPPFIACVQDMCYQHSALLDLQPASVGASCLASLQQPMGILLLEKSLLHSSSVPDEPPSKRARGRKEIPPDTERWIHLAKLYRSLGDYDVVRGIFGGKIGTKSITCTALQIEAKGDYAEAVKLYNEALNTEEWMDGEPTDTEKDFWEIAALEAYNHLTEWKSLQYCATVNIDNSSPVNLDRMWEDPFYQENYLQHMMRSMLKQLQQGQRDQALLSFVDAAMKVEQRKLVLETHYSQDLSLLYVLQEDYDRAKYYANNCMQVFMQNYSSVDPLLNRSRLTMLQSVQALTEIHDFLHYITGEVSVGSLKSLIKRWTSRYPDAKIDPMNVWDDIITSRCFFLDKIWEKLCSSPANSMEVDGAEQDSTAEELGALVKDCKFNMKLNMADSAWKQNNFSVATKLLKELHREAKAEKGWLQRWVHSFSRFSQRRSQSQGPAEQISSLLKTVPLLEEFEEQSEASTSKVFRDQRILLGTTFDLLASAVHRSPSALEIVGEEKAQRILELSRTSSSDQVVEGLQMRALELLHSAARKAEEEEQSFSQKHADTPGIVEAYMTLANFCDRRLREEEQREEMTSSPKMQSLPAHVVKMMLKALKLNSEEARLQFPRLLQLVELYSAETLDLMAKEVVSVPCWQLIGWISQMMALLDKPEAVAVQHVVKEIAECYPQALVYPFMISREGYLFEESVIGHANQEFVQKLKAKLDRGGGFQDFVDALQQLTNPEMLFKDWWDEVKSQLEKPKMDQKMMRTLYEEMSTSLCNSKAPGIGAFRKKFSQRFSKEVEKLFGPGGSKVYEKRKDYPYLRRVDELVSHMRGFQKEPGNLKEYSPWLSNFSADTLRNELEVPGQYDGRSKPLPEYHAKITGFDERVKVMTSIRRPKRLIMRGNDERDHPFLVKGGEDLRQDQRIEQLFGVMNIILSQDTACSQRSLMLRTYQVVPITSRIGLIEWMENTCTLKDFLASKTTDKEQKNIMVPNQIYDSWLSKIAGRTEGIRRYAETYRKANRTDTVNNFKRIEQSVPEDLLRRAFVKMSTTPEAFLSLRSHFTSSHALLCISHWVLGIGDRHLSNFMINTETGGMIGIDFGHAFGSATQFLPVPELMPFRLTRQFISLMKPMAESGLIRSVMVHSLRAFRDEPDLLLNTMDVFVKEPSLDWKNFALKQLKRGGTWTESIDTKEINWYPLQKINFARKKLEGANPSVITSEELRLGFEKDPVFKGMMTVARGTEEHNIRARLGEQELSVEEQVDCLIDQAADPNILGRTFVGWEPWM
ncbi:DNA-dependent protein kinase catalytic subunit-like isoform X1 [Neoarius graeffei]|uniref:DNA-dependent protein kinase catalytic subunit-like isoform X1 n=1 Tax=Neoarius graeffei TaxID=443677 RepID=UPI00298CBF40|nr:DNA-dependent protein kinase catalytic subunit-like isoform X1 [Neoarius graeffei]